MVLFFRLFGLIGTCELHQTFPPFIAPTITFFPNMIFYLQEKLQLYQRSPGYWKWAKPDLDNFLRQDKIQASQDDGKWYDSYT